MKYFDGKEVEKIEWKMPVLKGFHFCGFWIQENKYLSDDTIMILNGPIQVSKTKKQANGSNNNT